MSRLVSALQCSCSLCILLIRSCHLGLNLYPHTLRKYDEATQQEAVRWLTSNVNADWGGTEILSVLEAVYKMPLPDKASSSRQIVFLTDGGVGGGEEERIFDLVAGKAKSHKDAAARTTVFSLGIGHGVHRGLVEGMAKKVRGGRTLMRH